VLISAAASCVFLPQSLTAAPEGTSSGILDGKVFFGGLNKESQGEFEDNLSFADGLFWSEICIRCGFTPGEYWTRTEVDGIHFRGDLKNDIGTFSYEGLVNEGQATVDIFLEKERWYWTSGRTLHFEGSARNNEAPYSSSQAAQIARDALANNLPKFCF
jgi:hypothetical protein